MVGKLCVQFGTEAVYVRVMLKDFFKKVVYCGLMFFPLENHKTLKKSWEKELKREREVHQQEREVLMNQIKDFQQELQSVKASVCCKHLDLWDYWDMLLLVCDRTLWMKLVTVPIYIYIYIYMAFHNSAAEHRACTRILHLTILGISFKIHVNSRGRKNCPAYSCFCFLIPLKGLAYGTNFGVGSANYSLWTCSENSGLWMAFPPLLMLRLYLPVLVARDLFPLPRSHHGRWVWLLEEVNPPFTPHSAYSTGEIHFRALLIKNN